MVNKNIVSAFPFQNLKSSTHQLTQMLHRFSFCLLDLSFVAIILILLQPLSAHHVMYKECCRRFQCGNINNISYPFWGTLKSPYCGLPEFKLECQGEFPVIKIASEAYRVLKIDYDKQVLRLVRLDLYDNTCPSKFMNTTLTYLFTYTPNFGNLTMFFGCSSVSESLDFTKFACHRNGTSENGYYTVGSIPTHDRVGNCSVSITMPVLESAANALRNNLSSLAEVLNGGFEVHWITDITACRECAASGGRCGYNSSHFKPICFCPDRPYLMRCQNQPHDQGSKLNPRVRIYIAAFGACIITVIFILLFIFRRKLMEKIPLPFWRKVAKNSANLEDILQKCGPLAPKRYTYSDVKRITGFFRDKLGQGGYGVVYKGKLQDGRSVAVKVLRQSKASNGEEFINEVSSISRTSHVNIVTLMGFCFEGPKRALIYAFMPNGSLDNYIYDEKQGNRGPPLGWEKIFQIARGIAHGLGYLHRGCNTRIFHFDIKPQNILLDHDFCPKISDFGLAKLCLRKESKLSFLGARGTVGYMAPEVFSRHFGVVSHKSDVYSYGIMILEMVSGRKNTDIDYEQSGETYFPHRIYKSLEKDKEIKLQWVMDKTAENIARKMIIVGLWCIQTDPQYRPSMGRVLDMLHGNWETLPFPPKPFPSSPIRDQSSASNTSFTLLSEGENKYLSSK